LSRFFVNIQYNVKIFFDSFVGCEIFHCREPFPDAFWSLAPILPLMFAVLPMVLERLENLYHERTQGTLSSGTCADTFWRTRLYGMKKVAKFAQHKIAGLRVLVGRD
jgi:hypothetical protein